MYYVYSIYLHTFSQHINHSIKHHFLVNIRKFSQVMSSEGGGKASKGCLGPWRFFPTVFLGLSTKFRDPNLDFFWVILCYNPNLTFSGEVYEDNQLLGKFIQIPKPQLVGHWKDSTSAFPRPYLLDK